MKRQKLRRGHYRRFRHSAVRGFALYLPEKCRVGIRSPQWNPQSTETDRKSGDDVYRHTVPVRITHWLNVLFLTFMLGSGLQILNAHPSLYWGSRSDAQSVWLEIGTSRTAAGELRGYTRLFGREFDTTGVLGPSEDGEGSSSSRPFPRGPRFRVSAGWPWDDDGTSFLPGCL